MCVVCILYKERECGGESVYGSSDNGDGSDGGGGDVTVLRLFTSLAQICINKILCAHCLNKPF